MLFPYGGRRGLVLPTSKMAPEGWLRAAGREGNSVSVGTFLCGVCVLFPHLSFLLCCYCRAVVSLALPVREFSPLFAAGPVCAAPLLAIKSEDSEVLHA